MILPLVPLPLREAVSRLLHIDPEKRPTIQVLSMIKYFQYAIFIPTYLLYIFYAFLFQKKKKKISRAILLQRSTRIRASISRRQ